MNVNTLLRGKGGGVLFARGGGLFLKVPPGFVNDSLLGTPGSTFGLGITFCCAERVVAGAMRASETTRTDANMFTFR